MRIISTTFILFLPLLMVAQLNFNDKVDTYLQTQIYEQPEGYHEVFVLLEDQVDLDALRRDFRTKKNTQEEISFQLITQLQAKANATQPVLLARMASMKEIDNSSIIPLWITNVIQLKAKANAIASISKWTEVAWIEAVPQNILFDEDVEGIASPPSPNAAEQGLEAINAHKMWALGYTGYGTKVLIADSGTAVLHPGLRPTYWGNNVPNEQAWTGSERPEACNDHGTLVSGVIVGLDRSTNDTTGVAPNARWMGAPIDFGSCSLQQDVIGAAQVFQWATNPDNTPTTIDDRPDVLNNSWGNSSPTCDRTFNPILQTLEILNIAVVWAAGNSGLDGPMSVYGAQNINATLVNTFTVGNLDGRNLQISNDSSRGPSYCGGFSSLAIKPEVSAPGQSVRSTNAAGEYEVASGTSFSSPHVAGALLLLREAFPLVSAEDLKLALYFSARDLGEVGEDNAYGMGIIDVFAAYEYLINQGNTPTPPTSATSDALMVNIHTERLVNCLGALDVDISFENAGASNLQSLEISYYLNDDTANSTSINWAGNLGPNRIHSQYLTTFDDLPAGEHELTVIISKPNGGNDDRPLNNVMKHYIEVLDLDYVANQLSAQYENPVCNNSQVALESTTPLADNQTLFWYDRPAGSPLLNRGKLGEGPIYVSEALTESTIFYADILTTNSIGKTETTANASASSAELGITFDVFRPLTIKSVKVYAEGGGARFIRIDDDLGNSVGSKIANLSDGENIVDININIPVGVNYTMYLASNSRPLRISTSADYPYEIPDLMRLHTSTGTQFRYFYFFDWQIQSLHPCGRTAFTVNVAPNSIAPNVGFAVSAEEVALDESGTVEFNSTSSSTGTQHWDFGDGTQSNATNPTHNYTTVGEYIVTHTLTDGGGCASSAQKTIKVVASFETTSVENIADETAISVFPNPTSAQVVLQTRRAQKISVQVTDLLGRTISVKTTRINSTGLLLDMSPLADGVYYLLVDINGKKITKKLVKAS